uniref:Eukaryotic translation initiation factor 4E family member 2 related sequence 1 n=1 Tax=Stegastes partitus TaxID=144197 RepID=A0A3B4ZMR2_9TELE
MDSCLSVCVQVEQFWRFYSHLVRPGDLSGHSDFHLFKEGIKPMWEDESNRSGGKWIIRLRKGLASRFWENIILAMLGEQFMVGEEICGAVVSIRFQVLFCSWNHEQTSTFNETMKRTLSTDGSGGKPVLPSSRTGSDQPPSHMLT